MNTITKVYAAIAGIPLGAILLASAISGGGSNSTYDYEDYGLDASIEQAASRTSGNNVSEAGAYSSLGKYNPCIFIACEGE